MPLSHLDYSYGYLRRYFKTDAPDWIRVIQIALAAERILREQKQLRERRSLPGAPNCREKNKAKIPRDWLRFGGDEVIDESLERRGLKKPKGSFGTIPSLRKKQSELKQNVDSISEFP